LFFHTKPRDWLGEHLQNDLFCVAWDIKPVAVVSCESVVLCVSVKNVKNFYDIRNQLMNCIETEAKAKNAAFVASIPASPPAEQRSGPLLVLLKPNSIMLASSELAPNMFAAGSCQIPLH